MNGTEQKSDSKVRALHPLEIKFKEVFGNYRKIKSNFRKERDAEEQNNLKIKMQVIEDIDNLTKEEESIKKTFEQFRALQDKWKNTCYVPESHNNNLWQSYHSAYDSPHESSFNAESFIETALTRNLEEKDLDIFKDANGNINLNKGAMLRSDAIILASDQVNEDAKNTFESMDAPKLDANQDIEDKLPLYWEFFEPLVAEEQEAE
jgi:hypothetical protein